MILNLYKIFQELLQSMLKYMYRINILVTTIMSKNKLFLFLNILFLFCFSSAASEKEGTFYLKPLIIISKVNDVKEADQSTNFNLKHESNLSPSIGVGGGYYISDTVRVDLIFEHLLFYFPSESSSFDYTENNILNVGTRTVKRKVFANALMFNSYVDIINRDYYDIFIGIGVGAIQIKEKVYYLLSGNSINGNQNYTYPLMTETLTSKSVINFAHSLMIGTSIKLVPKINLELMYSWKDFGKTKYKIIDKEEIPMRNRYKGHHLSVGMRFNL